MKPERKAILAILLIIGILGVAYSSQRYRLNEEFKRTHPLSQLAEKINQGPHREECDERMAARRNYVATVVDRFHTQIKGLWEKREQKAGEAVPTIPIGKIALRISQPGKLEPGAAPLDFDNSSWSWEEVYGLVHKTQNDFLDENQLRLTWRDVDSITLYLLEKDFARVQLGRKFLAPERTEHQFRTNSGVLRSGPKEFAVLLDAGEFAGYEKTLQDILEKEWSGARNGFKVKIHWVKDNPDAYRFEANLSSGKTYVNHSRRAIVLENLAWTKTVAHEFGHVLGFDDHYYSVWNGEHCYYTQMARNEDLMSNSQQGKVGVRHWEILQEAYPTGKQKPSFIYVFSKSSGS